MNEKEKKRKIKRGTQMAPLSSPTSNIKHIWQARNIFFSQFSVLSSQFSIQLNLNFYSVQFDSKKHISHTQTFIQKNIFFILSWSLCFLPACIFLYSPICLSHAIIHTYTNQTHSRKTNPTTVMMMMIEKKPG